MLICEETWALLKTTLVSLWGIWACQLMSMVVATSKGYKYLSGLLSIAVPAKAFRVHYNSHWGKLQVKKPPSSVRQMLNGASVDHNAEREHRNLSGGVETWDFWLLMSQERTFVKYNNYWHFFINFTCAFSSLKLLLVQSTVFRFSGFHYSVFVTLE